MKNTLVLLFLSLSCLLIISCGSNKTKRAEVEYAYEENAIELHLEADPRLNFFQGRPHTLSICIYQLRDPNGFNQLTGDQEGLYELLECGRFDASVATFKSFSVQPGQQLRKPFSRAEGAEYVAVVAGYFTLQKEHMVRLFEIPVLQKRRWYNPFSTYQEIEILTINLLLGPQEIQEVKEEK